jgi:hypothetical protein
VCVCVCVRAQADTRTVHDHVYGHLSDMTVLGTLSVLP